MKQKFFKTMAVLMGMAMSVSLASCGDDDDDNGPVVPETGKIEKVTITYEADLSEDYLNFFAVESAYTNITGQTMKENIDTEAYQQVITGENLDVYPTECSFAVTANTKTDIPEINPDKVYTLDYSCKVIIYVYRTGKKEPERVDPGMVKTAHMTIYGSELVNYVKKSHKLCDLTYTIPAK